MSDKSVESEVYYNLLKELIFQFVKNLHFNNLSLEVGINTNITVYKILSVVFNKVYRRIVEET